ncbi:hypothetical protein Tco_0243322 [Tanacetum coccineum]
MLAEGPEVLSRGATVPSHQKKEVQKEERCSKGWKRVYSTGSETRRRMCPHIREIQGTGHIIVATEIRKAATKVLTPWNARVWFDDLPQESIDSYDDLRKTFLENYLQHKKCIKDPVEIHNIKQRDGESTE